MGQSPIPLLIGIGGCVGRAALPFPFFRQKKLFCRQDKPRSGHRMCEHLISNKPIPSCAFRFNSPHRSPIRVCPPQERHSLCEHLISNKPIPSGAFRFDSPTVLPFGYALRRSGTAYASMCPLTNRLPAPRAALTASTALSFGYQKPQRKRCGFCARNRMEV